MLKSFLLFLATSMMFVHSNAQGVSAKPAYHLNTPASVIEGAWTSVDGKEFSMMYNGYFSVVAQDSTGAWNEMHAGTYKVDDSKNFTCTVVYSSYPDHVGSIHTIEYSFSGGQLTLKFFKKLIDAKEGDITEKMPKDAMKVYVRAKK